MATKKTGRVKAALVCTETGATNYHTTVNKDNVPQFMKKFCKGLKKITKHKFEFKLK